MSRAVRGQAPWQADARIVALGALIACAGTRAQPDSSTDPAVDGNAAAYLNDPHARREALERSLTNHENLYSKQRLGSYGLVSRGWDLLPVWNPRAKRVTSAERSAIAEGATPNISAQPLWNGSTPSSGAEWVRLGERVFFEYPMRAEVFLEFEIGRAHV